MVKLSKFFIVGIAAIAAFGVKACGVVTHKAASSIAAGKVSVSKTKLARGVFVSEVALSDGLSLGSDDEESAAEGTGVRVPPMAYLLPMQGGASREVSIPAPAVKMPTFSIPQVRIGESDAERSMRLARDAEMRALENMMQHQQLQQMQEQQWRLQQQLRSAAGYPPKW